MATNSVNDYLWCVPLFPRGQLGRAVSVWPRCCSRAVAEEEKNKEEEGQQQEATSDTSSTDYVEGDYQL
jgi:hypothetical protein